MKVRRRHKKANAKQVAELIKPFVPHHWRANDALVYAKEIARAC